MSTQYKFSVSMHPEKFEHIVSSDEAFEDIVYTITEPSPDAELWVFEAYAENSSQLNIYAKYIFEKGYVSQSEIEIEEIPDIDWVAETQKNFQPFEVGQFFIYPSHYENPLPQDKINIQMDAGCAFGTGTHETTSLALSMLQKIENPSGSTLDLGCGTAILAIAAAKLWNKTFLASDIDPQSVEVAQKNCEINQVENLIQCLHAESLDHEKIKSHSPYELMIANILAEPLIYLAPEIAQACQKNGQIILSGYLTSQEEQLHDVYIKSGFQLKEVIYKNNWVCSLFQKI